MVKWVGKGWKGIEFELLTEQKALVTNLFKAYSVGFGFDLALVFVTFFLHIL